MSAAYAIFDTKDHCWIGNDQGVRVYEDCLHEGVPVSGEILARVAMTVMNVQYDVDHNPPRVRFRHAPYGGQAKKFKDEITPPISGVEAVQRYEARA